MKTNLIYLIALILASLSAFADESKNMPETTIIPHKAKKIIDLYKMNKIPHEGPWFLQTYKSDDIVEGALAERYDGVRYAYTAIVAVATRQEFSAMHRLKTDEMWHFYEGSPAEVLLLHPDGSGEIIIFGSDVLAGQTPQFLVPAGTWMGARPIGSMEEAYTFASNTLSPGFEYQDYEIGYRDELTAQYPKFKKQIRELTRSDSITRPKVAQAAPASPPPFSVQEMVGRKSKYRSEELSVAKFTLQAGVTSPASFNKTSSEALIVTHGKGSVVIDGKRSKISRGSVVYFPQKSLHSVTADTYMELYAVVTPAYHPEDNVVVDGQ